MPSPERLAEFVAVVEAGSVSAAARALELPRATLSRRISGLEAELGVLLLHRSTRRLVATPAGLELYWRARRIVADANAAWDAVRRLDDVPRGLLRVSTSGRMLDALCVRFALDFPEVQLEVHQTSRHVDLIAEGLDVAVRLGRVRDPNLIVRKVVDGRRVVVGSPDYLARRGTPATPDDLAGHDCLVDFAGEPTPQRRWPLLAGGEVAVSGPLSGNSVLLLQSAVLAGMGLALLPWPLVAEDVRVGRLVVVLEHEVGSDASLSVVFAAREFVDPKVRVFVDRVVRELGGAPTARPGPADGG